MSLLVKKKRKKQLFRVLRCHDQNKVFVHGPQRNLRTRIMEVKDSLNACDALAVSGGTWAAAGGRVTDGTSRDQQGPAGTSRDQQGPAPGGG